MIEITNITNACQKLNWSNKDITTLSQIEESLFNNMLPAHLGPVKRELSNTPNLNVVDKAISAYVSDCDTNNKTFNKKEAIDTIHNAIIIAAKEKTKI